MNKTGIIDIRKNGIGEYRVLEGVNTSNSYYSVPIPANTVVCSEKQAAIASGDLTKLETPANHISTIIIDQSYTVDPLHVLVTGDIAVEKDERGDVLYDDNDVPITKDPETNVISWIRKNTDLLCRRYNYDLNVMTIKKATEDDSYRENICMRLPEFWWKSTMIDEDHCKVDFCHEKEYVDDSWHHWDGNTLIDSRKVTAFTIDDNKDTTSNIYDNFLINGNGNRPNDYSYISNNKLSVSSVNIVPIINATQKEFKKASRDTCPNLSLVTYESHQIMALLFYAFYGDVDAQKICGNNYTNDYSFDQDEAASRIIKDSKATEEVINNRFWGLMDWWGNCNEFIDNLVVLSTHGSVGNEYYEDYQYVEVGVLDYEGKIKRIIKTTNYDEGTTKMILGENFDLLPRVDGVLPGELNGGEGDSNLFAWADGANASGAPGYVADRGGSGSSSDGGVAYLYVGFGADGFDRSIGSRLQYNGPMVEVDSFD